MVASERTQKVCNVISSFVRLLCCGVVVSMQLYFCMSSTQVQSVMYSPKLVPFGAFWGCKGGGSVRDKRKCGRILKEVDHIGTK